MPKIAYPTYTGSQADTLLDAGTVHLGGFRIELTKTAHADGLDTYVTDQLASREKARKGLIAGTCKLL